MRAALLQLSRHPIVRAGVAGCGLAAAARQHQSTLCIGAPPSPKSVKLALCQIVVGDDKPTNMKVAEAAVRKAVGMGAQIVSLPEIWNGPYAVDKFALYAEEVPKSASAIDEAKSPSVALMSKLSKELGIYLIGGSISERDAQGRVYNCSIVFGPDGGIITKHRKMHLFDIDIPGKITFKESDTLTGGDSATVFDTPYGRIGIGICYDIRFPMLANVYRDAGAHLIVYPGNFNLTTGPAHWELLQRGRAVDNQLWVATASQARAGGPGYQSYGHSMIVSPWGKLVAHTEEKSDIVFAEIDLDEVTAIRKNVPISMQKRTDLYDTAKWKGKL